MSTFEHIVIAGCNGDFGRVFGRKLAPHAARMTGVDLAEVPAEPALQADYVQGSIDRPGKTVLDRVAQADCLVLCVPEAAVLAGLGALLGAARPDACITDIASVKTRIAARVAELGGAAGYLGLHPMFAPSIDFSGRNLVAVRIRANAATARLEAVVEGWRARLSVLSAEQHDRLAAWVQALPHAALLAFGAALSESGLDRETSERIATPVHETMLALLARVLHGREETYWSIQADNPYAAETRAALAAALAKLDSIANGGDEAGFARLVEGPAAYLGDAFGKLVARSEHAVDAPGAPGAAEPPPSGPEFSG